MTTAPGSITQREVTVPTNLERRAFLYMRLSGLALIFLAVGHMLIQHLILSNSQTLNLEFVAQQWEAWGWKVYDMLLLIFALTHGFNGFRNVLEDYLHRRTAVKWINRFLLLFMIITVIYAGIAISLFDSTEVFQVLRGAG